MTLALTFGGCLRTIPRSFRSLQAKKLESKRMPRENLQSAIESLEARVKTIRDSL
jgi:hypothetical protein